LRWTVIEQPGFVEAGRREFSTPELSFSKSMAEVPSGPQPPLLLASSVLQYLELTDPILAQWADSDATTLVIDRTPVGSGEKDALAIQHVPSHIYRASYPCWVLSRQHLLARLEADWTLLAEFDCPEGRRRLIGGADFEFRGFVLERDPIKTT
jgi:putative methyltransferase (TIGR04325 family)